MCCLLAKAVARLSVASFQCTLLRRLLKLEVGAAVPHALLSLSCGGSCLRGLACCFGFGNIFWNGRRATPLRLALPKPACARTARTRLDVTFVILQGRFIVG